MTCRVLLDLTYLEHAVPLPGLGAERCCHRPNLWCSPQHLSWLGCGRGFRRRVILLLVAPDVLVRKTARWMFDFIVCWFNSVSSDAL